jgi:hypothetical protein
MITGSALSTAAKHSQFAGAVRVGSFRDGDLALVLAICFQVLEFWYAYPATVLKMVLVALCTFPGRSAYLPALLICQFFASDFQLGDLQTYEYLLERHESARVTILGFPLTTNYVFAVCVTLRVLHEALTRPRTFSGVISLVWIWVWMTCFLPAVLSATLAKAEARFSWTAPIRDVMMVGCLFYGIILARNIEETKSVITRRFVPLACSMLTLAMAGYFYSRGMYFVTALGPALFFSWKAFAGRAGRLSVYAYLFTLSTLYAFAIYPTAYAQNVAESIYSTSGNSTALVACWLLPLIIVLFISRNVAANDVRRGWVNALPVSAAFFAFGFPILFAVFSMTYSADLDKIKDPGKLPLQQRIVYKLFSDRGPIWRGALDEILQPPFFLKTGGYHMGYKLMLNGDKQPWPAGSHNLALEELRRNGWYTGVVCLILILRGSVFSLRTVIKSSDPIVRSFAIASFSSLFILSATSHIPMETNAALWLLAPAGMCAALIEGRHRQSEWISKASTLQYPGSLGMEPRSAFAH